MTPTGTFRPLVMIHIDSYIYKPAHTYREREREENIDFLISPVGLVKSYSTFFPTNNFHYAKVWLYVFDYSDCNPDDVITFKH